MALANSLREGMIIFLSLEVQEGTYFEGWVFSLNPESTAIFGQGNTINLY
jgi:hypothetical protein